MKRFFTRIFAISLIYLEVMIVNPIFVNAQEEKNDLIGKIYDLDKKDAYEISKGKEVSDLANRFAISGDISSISSKNGIVSYAVNSGNLKIFVNEQFLEEIYESEKNQDWHIIKDKSKVVDSTTLDEKIGSGAIILQTSKNGKTWINIESESDIYKKVDTLNNRFINGEERNAFYETTNIQITNGCYYRIVVAYKLQREVEPKKDSFFSFKTLEEKERIEIYQFYAYDPSINQNELLTKDAYEFGDVSDVYRVDDQNGFKNPVQLKSDDPHIDWTVGKFYISGYTDVRMEDEVPVFLKVPGDKAALWFNLEHELDKCNGRSDVKVEYIDSGSDIYFGTPTINNFGKGALIIRKTIKNNNKERQIYTNYLEASATVGANTRVDLFEEGDYEVALDYQLHYDNPFIFGITTTKTLTYRVFFKFKVRNGDISLFLRDVDTNQFITNANVVERGFYIDVANSQYLNISIKREVLTDSLDGLIEDTRFKGVAKEGRDYTDEGIYTITVKNLATGDSVEKKIYVGDGDIMCAHMRTGFSISEIKEKLEQGAYIDDDGRIIDPKSQTVDLQTEDVNENVVPGIAERGDNDNSEIVKISTKNNELSNKIVKDEKLAIEKKNRILLFSIIAILIVLLITGISSALIVKNKMNKLKKKEDEE